MDPKISNLLEMDEMEKIRQSWIDVVSMYESGENLVKLNYTNVRTAVFHTIRISMGLNGRRIRDSTIEKFARIIWREIKIFKEKTKMLYMSKRMMYRIVEQGVSLLLMEHFARYRKTYISLKH